MALENSKGLNVALMHFRISHPLNNTLPPLVPYVASDLSRLYGFQIILKIGSIESAGKFKRIYSSFLALHICAMWFV